MNILTGDCECVKGAVCCYCKKKLKTETELKKRTDPYPIKNKDERFHLLCDPCKDV